MQSLSVFHQYAERSHFLALEKGGKYKVSLYRCDPFFSLHKAIRKKKRWSCAIKECIESIRHWLISWLDWSTTRIYAIPPTHPFFILLTLLWWRPGKRIYFTSFTDWGINHTEKGGRRVCLNARFIVRYFDAVATVNTAGYNYFNSLMPTALVEHAVEGCKFKHHDFENKDNQKRMVFVGRLTHYKRIDELAQHCVAKGYKLDIIGPAEDEQLQDKIEKNCINNVRWLGPRDRSWIENNLCEYDALIVSSDYREPYGIVMLEAMAAGIVIIVSRSYGSETLFRDWLDYPLLAKNKGINEVASVIDKFQTMSGKDLDVIKVRLKIKTSEYSPLRITLRWDSIL